MVDSQRRERLLTFLVLPAIVVATLVLIGVMFRSSFQLEKLREQSVLEATLGLANEKADRLDKWIIKQDDTVKSLQDANEGFQFVDEWLEVATIQTPTVRAVLLLDLTSPMNEVVAFASRAPGVDDERFRRMLVRTMLGDMKLGGPQRAELRHLHGTYEEQSYLLSHWEREIQGRRYLTVVWHDVPRIVHDVFTVLYSDNDRKSRVNVVDADGRIVFGPPLSRGKLTLGRQFETTLYKWRLNVTVASAEELAAEAERRRMHEMVLVSLAGIVVVAGMIVVLVAAARERKLSNLKSEFVANVSHELKTPLSLVRMFGELLQTGRVDSDEKRRQYLQIIVNESERLAALIENVLDFAKVERGKAAYSFAPGQIDEALVRAADVCRVRAEREGVSLELEIAAQSTRAIFDERAVEVALINLIDNALKYAPDGKRVHIQLVQDSRRFEIRVVDHGPGIPPEDRKRIFERFVRGKGQLHRQVRGSGIGLALVRHIAEAHGGTAWVEAAEGGGSCFVFTIRAPEPVADDTRTLALEAGTGR